MKYKGINMYIIYLYIKMGYCGIIGVCGFCKDFCLWIYIYSKWM